MGSAAATGARRWSTFAIIGQLVLLPCWIDKAWHDDEAPTALTPILARFHLSDGCVELSVEEIRLLMQQPADPGVVFVDGSMKCPLAQYHASSEREQRLDKIKTAYEVLGWLALVLLQFMVVIAGVSAIQSGRVLSQAQGADEPQRLLARRSILLGRLALGALLLLLVFFGVVGLLMMSLSGKGG